jgi:hypothetical protein
MFENQLHQNRLQSLTSVDGSTIPVALLSQYPYGQQIQLVGNSPPDEEHPSYEHDEGLRKSSSMG